jgi:hypothetical protein
MELVGNEKQIQALFHELKFADEGAAPEFIRVWNRAQATPPRSVRVFKLSFALAMGVVVITLGAVVLWSRNWQRIQPSTPHAANVSEKPGSTLTSPAVTSSATQLVIAEPPHRSNFNRRLRKLAARHQPDINSASVVTPETVAISSWQSPTAILLQSPADGVLTSLPQLDLSLNDLKTFLPNTLQ